MLVGTGVEEEEEEESVQYDACPVLEPASARSRGQINGGQMTALVGGFVAVIACVMGRAFHRMTRNNAVLRQELEDAKTKYEGLISELSMTKNALEDINKEMMQKDVQMSDMAVAVEEKAKTLKEQQALLEKLKGELGLSKSTVNMVERELKATKQLLASYQGQADQAHVLRESNRENVATPGSLGIASLWI
jgi:septal ring factor EnvC (AmiA/AmiB activator)